MLEFVAQRAVADKKQAQVRLGFDDIARGQQQVLVSLERHQPPNLAHDESFRWESEFAAQGRIIFGCEEGFDFETAKDPRVHFRFADPGSKIAAGHRLGGANKMICGARRVTFGAPKERIGNGALKGAEGRSVNMMNDHLDTRSPRREASKEACLTTVGMDDVGTQALEQGGQARQGSEL